MIAASTAIKWRIINEARQLCGIGAQLLRRRRRRRCLRSGDKLDFAFEDMGEQSVKNIARPVRVYALRPETVVDRPLSEVPSPKPAPQPLATPRLSIVVLPFANLSSDPEHQYFADGITEDLTTDLSRLAGMLVISHNTAVTYRNKPVDTKQIGRELRVRYVLEGSVRRSDSRVRINAQLIDADSDAHLWAERFDGDASDLFTLQDEITGRIAFALNLELAYAESTVRKMTGMVMPALRICRSPSIPSGWASASPAAIHRRCCRSDRRGLDGRADPL
jgi:TolB-like protein